MPVSPTSVHVVTFKRDLRYRNLWKCTCSCGWIMVGVEERVKQLAAAHDITWDDEPIGQFEAAAIRRQERETPQ